MLYPYQLPVRRLLGRPNTASTYYLNARRSLHVTAKWNAKTLQKFKLADIGEGITECEIIKWSVKPDSTIQAFDPLCEVQSDKASVEITSPFDGILKEILVKEGDIAKVGAGLCIIEVDDEGLDVDNLERVDTPSEVSTTTTPPQPARETLTPPAVAEKPHSERRLHPLDPNYVAPPQSPPSHRQFKPQHQEEHLRGTQDVLAMPSVRHHARFKGVDLALLAPGSGRDGRIERVDVDAYLTGSQTVSSSAKDSLSQPAEKQDVVVELNRTRYNMYKAMEKSLEIPHFGYSTTLDVTNLHNLMKTLNTSIPPRYLPESKRPSFASLTVNPSALYPASNEQSIREEEQFDKLTFLPVLLKSLATAMMEWPLLRSSLTPTSKNDGEIGNKKPTLTIRPNADISLALSTPTGLYTPTIVGANAHSVYDVQRRLKWFQHLGRQMPCALTPKEMPKRGGTLTVSNVGSIGKGVFASPVLVPGGGVAICAIGRAEWTLDVSDKYWNKNGHGERRLKLPISWSADHRVVEGAELAAFVECWRDYVEDPGRLIGVLV